MFVKADTLKSIGFFSKKVLPLHNISTLIINCGKNLQNKSYQYGH